MLSMIIVKFQHFSFFTTCICCKVNLLLQNLYFENIMATLTICPTLAYSFIFKNVFFLENTQHVEMLPIMSLTVIGCSEHVLCFVAQFMERAVSRPS